MSAEGISLSGGHRPGPAVTWRASGICVDAGWVVASVQVKGVSLMFLKTADACERTRGFESLALRPDRRPCV